MNDIENRMVLDRAWPRERGEEWFDSRDNRADQINDDLWLAEVAKQIPLIRQDLNECLDKLEKNDA